MKKIAIIHFSPVERYPPATNWLDFLADHGFEEWDVRVFTMHPDIKVQKLYVPSKAFIAVKRFGSVRKEQRSIIRYWNYFHFYLKTLLKLIMWRPDIVLYYETLSALPALLYKKYFHSRAGLFVHYHEYISAQEYIGGIPLNKWPHRMEQKSYPLYQWISHTNEDRMRLFTNDNKNILERQAHILPNYPPASWRGKLYEKKDGILKFVYVGALDMETMYTAAFAKWIVDLNGKARWDIFSSNITPDAKDHLTSLHSENIRFMGSVEYSSLPDILKDYDVGVVLYKGTTLNYVYNIPNKLYEYWACGLDVWFAEELKSSLRLVTTGIFPIVKAVNFCECRNIELNHIRARGNMLYKPSPFYAEEVLPALLNEMKEFSVGHKERLKQ